jgi:hypothetical protein
MLENSVLVFPEIAVETLISVQLVPISRSARASVFDSELTFFPTAIQKVVEAQETSVSLLSLAPVGLGVVVTDHADPFQARERVLVTPEET